MTDGLIQQQVLVVMTTQVTCPSDTSVAPAAPVITARLQRHPSTATYDWTLATLNSIHFRESFRNREHSNGGGVFPGLMSATPSLCYIECFPVGETAPG